MIDTSQGAAPVTDRPPLLPALLLLAVLPAGLLVMLIDLLAYTRTKATLPGARPNVNADAVGPALAAFADFGPHRLTLIAGFFAAATLAFATLAWVLRRGAFRWPAALLLAAGTLTAAYLAGLFQVFAHDPVHDFTGQVVDTPGPGSATVPWAMDTLSPDWYIPALAAVLIAAAAAPVAACALLSRPRATSWIAGGRTVVVSVRAHRRSALLLTLMPATTPILYAAVNLVAIAAAAHAGDASDGAADISRRIAIAMTAVLAVVAAGWTILGVRLRYVRAWPASLPAAGALLVVHLLVLRLVWDYQPLGHTAFPDDQSGLLENRPSWHAPGLALTVGLAAVWPVAALLGMATAGRRSATAQDEDITPG
ncbi:hypothetical protein SMC26_06100 [Actinomadura fulvescens]|uniref:Integral membrane protein n=1 Tax=Actinomadura fulvescens TaxID=46160 RepID=A0ABP6BVY8_9ACTN